MTRPLRVLLLWPGTTGAAAGNFGVPQLVSLATYVRDRTGAEVHIRDLVAEKALGRASIPGLFRGDDGRGYDIVAFGVYSSFDYLPCIALAGLGRKLLPDAVFVAGGYHASARPMDIVREGSPFDACIVGEGERPLADLVESVEGGSFARGTVLGPNPITDLDALPLSDWSFLARYRGVARRIASQAQAYLSRGCPFDCAFCMERAKREVSWRSFSVDRAVEEVHALHRFLDLRGWTLYVADALFGMKKSWRREFLEKLAAKPVPVDKLWLLIRVDLVEPEDLRLFHAANCGLGFGLESGDRNQLAIIRKAGRLDDYLERIVHVAEWARERNVPWGGNVIVGHPGETRESLARSADFLRRLFLDPRGSTGFLSVDPFRLYPGSPIDADRAHYESTYGTRFHRAEWWHDGDQEFLSEWVDPSAELDWSAREAVQHEHFAPILQGIESNFVYDGPARAYFLRAVRGQAKLTSQRQRLHFMDRYYAWMRYVGRGREGNEQRRVDAALADVARACRAEARSNVAERARVSPEAPVLEVVEAVPRERFVPLDAVAASTRDEAIRVAEGSTVSAMHAYARAFSLLDVRPGEHVLDLGAGTGYGSAILSELVGPEGRVTAVELDPALVEAARTNLRNRSNVRILCGNAADPAQWGTPGDAIDKVYAGFALDAVPAAWLRALRPGAVIVAPVASGSMQRLVRQTVGADAGPEMLEEVRYVQERSAAERGLPPEAGAGIE